MLLVYLLGRLVVGLKLGYCNDVWKMSPFISQTIKPARCYYKWPLISEIRVSYSSCYAFATTSAGLNISVVSSRDFNTWTNLNSGALRQSEPKLMRKMAVMSFSTLVSQPRIPLRMAASTNVEGPYTPQDEASMISRVLQVPSEFSLSFHWHS